MENRRNLGKSLLVFSSFAFGLFYGLGCWAAFAGSVSSAMGNTGVASPEISDGPRLNPALMGFVRGYIFSTGFNRFADGSGFSGDSLVVGISDHQKDSVVPTALTFYQENTSDEFVQSFSQKNFQLGFGNRVSNKWAFGLALNYWEGRATTPSGETPVGYPEKISRANLTIGSVFPFSQYFGLGIVAENVVEDRSRQPENWGLVPRTTFGLNYEVPKTFQLRAELRSAPGNSFSKSTAGLGIQSFPNRWLAVRIGAARELQTDLMTYSAGLGFLGPKFGFHYAYVQTPEAGKLARHSVDLALPLW
jgi:hypothetical protein